MQACLHYLANKYLTGKTHQFLVQILLGAFGGGVLELIKFERYRQTGLSVIKLDVFYTFGY